MWRLSSKSSARFQSLNLCAVTSRRFCVFLSQLPKVKKSAFSTQLQFDMHCRKPSRTHFAVANDIREKRRFFGILHIYVTHVVLEHNDIFTKRWTTSRTIRWPTGKLDTTNVSQKSLIFSAYPARNQVKPHQSNLEMKPTPSNTIVSWSLRFEEPKNDCQWSLRFEASRSVRPSQGDKQQCSRLATTTAKAKATATATTTAPSSNISKVPVAKNAKQLLHGGCVDVPPHVLWWFL